MPWATEVARQGARRGVPATLSTGTLLVHSATEWTTQGCAGFENPVLVSRYRIVGGEHAGAMALAVKFLDMHWQMFDEASMLHPVVPEEGRRGRGGGRA